MKRREKIRRMRAAYNSFLKLATDLSQSPYHAAHLLTCNSGFNSFLLELKAVKKEAPRRKKLRCWKARVMLFCGSVVHVTKPNGAAFNNGMFASTEGPVPVEIRELTRKSR